MITPMTAREESFLVLEESLTNRLTRQWESDINRTLTEIVRAVNEARWQDAEKLCEDLSMQKVAEKNKRYMEFVGMQAVLFGASRLTRGHVARTSFMTQDEGMPPEVERASQALSDGLSTEGSNDICQWAQKLINEERAAQEAAMYETDQPSTGDVETVEEVRTFSERRKQATDTFIRQFSSSVRGNGEAYINITSSLHTSRLGAWGFLQEAKFRGITQYQVSEQLDSRTCKVCQTMHGRKFAVNSADQKLNNWLSVENLQQMKSIAPWPKQNKKSIDRLSKMGRTELQSNGWDTPPYHPRCRGILVEEGSIPETLPKRDPRVESFIDDVEITQSAKEELQDLAAQAVSRAEQADDFVTPQIRAIADDINATFPAAAAPGAPPGAEQVIDGSLTYYRLKDKGSSARKIQTYASKYGITNSQAADRLSDSLRYTYVLDEDVYVDGIRAAMERFADLGYKNGKFDAAWFTRPDYKGVNVNLVTPQGVKMELQFHTPTSFEIKQNINHVLYEQYRTLSKAKQAGPEGAAIQKLMKDNADGIPIPLNIELLEAIAKLYNKPGAF